MNKLIQMYVMMRSKLEDKKGATMVEYGLMLALIAAVAAAGAGLIGTNANTMFGAIAAKLPATIP